MSGSGCEGGGNVVLVRHARAGDPNGWNQDDRLRPLDRRGLGQASALTTLLGQLSLAAVLSSPARRCVQTVEPLAQARGLPVQEREDLWEQQPQVALDLVLSLVGSDTLICTHGDIIPSILEHLAVGEGLDLGPHLECQKASTWILTARAGRYVTARYLAPPPT